MNAILMGGGGVGEVQVRLNPVHFQIKPKYESIPKLDSHSTYLSAQHFQLGLLWRHTSDKCTYPTLKSFSTNFIYISLSFRLLFSRFLSFIQFERQFPLFYYWCWSCCCNMWQYRAEHYYYYCFFNSIESNS